MERESSKLFISGDGTSGRAPEQRAYKMNFHRLLAPKSSLSPLQALYSPFICVFVMRNHNSYSLGPDWMIRIQVAHTPAGHRS